MDVKFKFSVMVRFKQSTTLCLILKALRSPKCLIWKLWIQITYSFGTKSFEAKGLILRNRALHLCPHSPSWIVILKLHITKVKQNPETPNTFIYPWNTHEICLKNTGFDGPLLYYELQLKISLWSKLFLLKEILSEAATASGLPVSVLSSFAQLSPSFFP